jgi:large subunit ribosomal protein L11
MAQGNKPAAGKGKAKVVVKVIKLQITAGKATPAPPIGPALGQAGLNIMEFCKAYNEQTRDKGGLVIPVEITVYQDKTFTFVLKTPPVSVLILQAISKAKGSATPNTNFIGMLNRSQLEEIAKIKMADLNTDNIESAVSVVAGSARSMGVKVTL